MIEDKKRVGCVVSELKPLESHKNKSRRSVEIGLGEEGMKQDFIKFWQR